MAKKFGSNMLGSSMKTMGNLKLPFVGDPDSADTKPTKGISSPELSPQQTMVNETPVQQSTKNGKTHVLPMPVAIPGPTTVIPLPPVGEGKLDPEIQRHFVVDQFTKSTRVEVAYV